MAVLAKSLIRVWDACTSYAVEPQIAEARRLRFQELKRAWQVEIRLGVRSEDCRVNLRGKEPAHIIIFQLQGGSNFPAILSKLCSSLVGSIFFQLALTLFSFWEVYSVLVASCGVLATHIGAFREDSFLIIDSPIGQNGCVLSVWRRHIQDPPTKAPSTLYLPLFGVPSPVIIRVRYLRHVPQISFAM